MKMPATRIAALLALFLLIALLAPVVSYIVVFGTSLSRTHAEWAQFGDFIGGIYASLAALLTLVIIFMQLSSQLSFNKHQVDRTFLNQSNGDLHFYIDQLNQIFSKREAISNTKLCDVLISMFGSRTHDQLKSAIVAKDVKRISLTDGRICGLWSAIYAVLSGLRSSNEDDYALAYSSAKLKCVAVFGYALCDALDGLHYASCNYPSDFRYEFHHPPAS